LLIYSKGWGKHRQSLKKGGFVGKKISGDMLIQEIIQKHPETLRVFREYKLECMNCQIAQFEEISHGAEVHHISPDILIAKLNAAISANSPE